MKSKAEWLTNDPKFLSKQQKKPYKQDLLTFVETAFKMKKRFLKKHRLNVASSCYHKREIKDLCGMYSSMLWYLA